MIQRCLLKYNIFLGERIAWMMANKKDQFSINHKYADIKTQKISPQG